MNPGKDKSIGYWLLTGCFLIFCMVIIGGITRLTGSGLSITEWKPVMGAIPPMNDTEWQDAFEKYKQIPQFQKLNSHFELDDFKSIFWWEFIHRLLGRLIGVVFIVPFAWFYFKKKFNNASLKKVLFLFLLGGLQGVIGWLMVKSGLTERTSVSHIRLAIHLITAFITFGFTFYYALEILSEDAPKNSSTSVNRLVKFLLILTTVQIIYGALVAGMHAGKIYNTFPLMNGKIIPSGRDYLTPGWTNLFDNPIAVQFIHRLLALIITILAFVLYYISKNRNHILNQKNGVLFLLSSLTIQIILGILTLLTFVNIPLALLHQTGAFILFSSCVYVMFVYRKGSTASGVE